MKRAEMLRVLALAPLAPLLAGCEGQPMILDVADPADLELTALRDRAIALLDRIELEGGADGQTGRITDALVQDIFAWKTKYRRDDVTVRTGLALEDIPESIRTAQALLGQPWGPGCKCVGYWTGCVMYIPYGKDTCEQGSCVFVCIDWFCRFFPRA